MANDGLGLVWFMNLGIPLLVLGFAYGCGGQAVIMKSLPRGERPLLLDTPTRPAATSLEGLPPAYGLAKRWNSLAQLIRVDGLNVQPDGRLAEASASRWVYAFHRRSDDRMLEVSLDGHGTLVGQPMAPSRKPAGFEEPLDDWRIDSPFVAKQVELAQLPVGEDLDMQLTRDGVWRVLADDGQSLREIQVDASTGRRLLAIP